MRQWRSIPGTVAHALANGADGSIWHVGQDQRIYRWGGAGWQIGPSCWAVRVAAARDGAPWHIGRDGVIYRWTSGGWRELPGTRATELAIGGDAVWHIAQDGGLYRWVGGDDWTRDPTARQAKRLTVRADGTPWHIGTHDMIYRKVPGGWRQVQGPAGALAAGIDGSVLHAGNHGMFTWFTIYRWNGEDGWQAFSDSATGNGGMLAVDGAGGLWCTFGARSSEVYRYQ
jgi:hypothetical protein